MGQLIATPINMVTNTTTAILTYNGSKGIIEVEGDFDSGTLNLEYSYTGSFWKTDTNFVLTANGIKEISRTIPIGTKFRFVLSGVVTASNINITVGQGEGR